MVLLLLAGLAGVLWVVRVRRRLVDRVQGHGLTRHLLRFPWFHRDTGAGGFLLASNLVAAAFPYRLAGPKPAYPGDDLVMAAVGLIAAVLVTSVAFATCLLIVGFSGRHTRAA